MYIYIASLSLHLPLKTESMSFVQNQPTKKKMTNAVFNGDRQGLGAVLSLAAFHNVPLLQLGFQKNAINNYNNNN